MIIGFAMCGLICPLYDRYVSGNIAFFVSVFINRYQ